MKKEKTVNEFEKGLPRYDGLRGDLPEERFLRDVGRLAIKQDDIPNENAELPSFVGYWNVQASCARHKMGMIKMELETLENSVAFAFREAYNGEGRLTEKMVEEHVALHPKVRAAKGGLEEIRFVVDLMQSLLSAYELKGSCLVSAGAYDRQERDAAISSEQMKLRSKFDNK